MLGRVGSVCAPCWRSCMSKLEPAKSGDLSDTSLEYCAKGWRSLLRSVRVHNRQPSAVENLCVVDVEIQIVVDLNTPIKKAKTPTVATGSLMLP